MEAKLVEALPEGPGWQYEPKWDGFRCLAFVAEGEADLRAKSGKPLTRYFPEVAAMLAGAKAGGPFAVDGELVVPVDGALSFDALQMRLHPAESRVRRLAAETPALFVLFDCLASPEAPDLTAAPLSARRAALERLFARIASSAPALRLSPFTRDRARAQAWLEGAGGALDGVIAKARDGLYRPGERAMLKVKRRQSADCVVGGFRYERDTAVVGSLLLGLYDQGGLLHHVGFTSTLSNEDRPALTRRLEALAEPPGFTGSAPGGPSRWATEKSAEWTPLRPELVVEVRYDQVTAGRFRHGTTLLRWRPDKAPAQCTFDQLAPPARLDDIEALGAHASARSEVAP
jgi:ATP-dependent DNA ligase